MGLTRGFGGGTSFLLRGLLPLVSLVQAAIIVGAHISPAAAAAPPVVPATATTRLDSVNITVHSSLMRNLAFTTSDPGDASQVATAEVLSPYRELVIVAVPFGTHPSAEGLPAAGHGAARSYAGSLARYRRSEGGHPIPSPAINMFGRMVTGLISTDSIHLDATGPAGAVAIAEWTVEAGPRLWIVRAARELIGGEDQRSAARSFADLGVGGGNLAQRSTVSSSSPKVRKAIGDPPSWWRGSCNVYRHPGSFALGTLFRGMPACGPRPIAGGGDVLVRFFPGSWGVYEWECVELSMRYLYVTYGQTPYPANGKDVVANYRGTRLRKINNGTVGRAPVPGDVLSYGATTAFGHTSVVASTNVNARGNGYITVIEENNSARGATTMAVRGWTVLGRPYAVGGWLHDRRDRRTR